MIALDFLGFLFSVGFTLFWLYACYTTVVDPPTDDPHETVFLYVVLTAGLIVCWRALFYAA